jgi:hypothetical protein
MSMISTEVSDCKDFSFICVVCVSFTCCISDIYIFLYAGKLDVFHKDEDTGELVKTHEYEAGDSCGLSSILFKKPHT